MAKQREQHPRGDVVNGRSVETQRTDGQNGPAEATAARAIE